MAFCTIASKTDVPNEQGCERTKTRGDIGGAMIWNVLHENARDEGDGFDGKVRGTKTDCR